MGAGASKANATRANPTPITVDFGSLGQPFTRDTDKFFYVVPQDEDLYRVGAAYKHGLHDAHMCAPACIALCHAVGQVSMPACICSSRLPPAVACCGINTLGTLTRACMQRSPVLVLEVGKHGFRLLRPDTEDPLCLFPWGQVCTGPGCMLPVLHVPHTSSHRCPPEQTMVCHARMSRACTVRTGHGKARVTCKTSAANALLCTIPAATHTTTCMC
jgi:hypothetical protein